MINEEKGSNGYKKWKDSASSSASVFVYAMNNYWHTNFMASQQDPITFDVFLKFRDGKFDKAFADRFGYESTTPVFVICNDCDKSSSKAVNISEGHRPGLSQ
jgi:hypothetical protein